MSEPVEYQSVLAEHTELLAAIGGVVTACAEMEATAAEVYIALLASPAAEFVAHGLPWTNVQTACLELLKRLPSQPYTERTKTVLIRAGELYEQRNRVVHGRWAPGPADGEFRHLFFRRRRHGRYELALIRDIDVLHSLGDGLAETARELIGLAEEIATSST